tara:strand:- start:527 stop:682 length:156 start_codon:yes stop_codon:yes gene_type:complete
VRYLDSTAVLKLSARRWVFLAGGYDFQIFAYLSEGVEARYMVVSKSSKGYF